MKTKLPSTFALLHSVAALLLMMAGALLFTIPPSTASTVAYWRFEEGPADTQVLHGGQADGVFYPGTADSSGNGNHLSVCAEGWAGYAYRLDTPSPRIPATDEANGFSVQNTGSNPGMFNQTNTAMQTMTPAAFTIEVSVKPESGGWRTLVGRDSAGTVSWGPDLPALYLQITPQDAVAIKFCDISGYWHEALSATGMISGFTYPYSNAGHWYHLAAVSDGTHLSLYLNSDFGYRLVAQTDLTVSGSPNTALTAGLGSGPGWVAGTWSVGRGLYAGAHTDRAYGFIDEVRISDVALAPEQFLFWPRRILVTNTADSGPGSLRAALASALDGDTIDATGVAGTITLTNGELVVSSSVAILGPGPETLTVSGNHASRVFNVSNKNVILRGLTIANGATYGFGGGIYNYGTLMFTACRLTANSADVSGGGINNWGKLTLTGCTLSENSANYYGGGIFNEAGTLTLTTCTLSANSAGVGGGIFNYGTLTLTGCTFSANYADCGGGIYNMAMLTLGDTILNAGSRGENVSAPSVSVISTGYNLSSDDDWFLWNATDRVNTDPLLGPLQDNGGPTWTHALLPGSPALDAGDDALLALLPTDQRGLARKSGAHVDIGAYEVQQPNATPSLTGISRSTNGAIQFNFTNAPGVQFTVLATTNVALSASHWTVLSSNWLLESPPGFYQFTDPSLTNDPQRYYRLRWP